MPDNQPIRLPPTAQVVESPPRCQASPADPCAMVIFGASGDLTKRLVIPALYNLSHTKVLPEKFESPEYTAVIEAPVEIFKVELEKLALPAPLMVPLPRSVDPFLKPTVPVGVPEPVCETVAVNTTSWPNSAGFSEEINAVAVVDSIFSVSVADVLPRKSVAPL